MLASCCLGLKIDRYFMIFVLNLSNKSFFNIQHQCFVLFIDDSFNPEFD